MTPVQLTVLFCYPKQLLFSHFKTIKEQDFVINFGTEVKYLNVSINNVLVALIKLTMAVVFVMWYNQNIYLNCCVS